MPSRINLLLIIVSCLLSFVILAYIFHFMIILLARKPRIVQPNLKSKSQSIYFLDNFINLKILFSVGFPIPHFGILNSNGTFTVFISPLLDSKFEKSVSLKKLPNPGLNGNVTILSFVAQTQIFFIYGDPSKPMVKFDIENDNHRILPKFHIPITQTFQMNGVKISDKFWVMGGKPGDSWGTLTLGSYFQSGLNSNKNSKTSFWSISKAKWINGPNIPHNPNIFGYPLLQGSKIIPEMLFARLVTLNKSTVFLLSTHHMKKFTVSYNILTNSWTDHESIPPVFEEFALLNHCVLDMAKDRKKYIISLFQKLSSNPEFVLGIYDIDFDSWSDPLQIPTKNAIGKYLYCKDLKKH